MPDPKNLNPLAQIIKREITRHGAISFVRFMELALYCPQLGFYERKKDSLGHAGDFYTSVSTGSLFGQLLAYQFADWLEAQGRKSEVRIIEAGAHDGKLAVDILRWLKQQRPQLFAQLKYVILEPSATRRAWQAETLNEFADHLAWQSSTLDLRPSTLPTIFFSNELFDAFPVHRLGWDAGAKKWFEWGVSCDGDQFNWTRLSEKLEIENWKLKIAPGLLAALPDGYTIEVCPAAEIFYGAAAASVGVGRLVTVDYGFSNSEELFEPARFAGTLRAYHRHQVSDDLLAHVGEQDLTAHVNFPTLIASGELLDWHTETFQTQSQFLTAIAARVWKNSTTFGEWTPHLTRQFQTLTHPEHLGRAFRVLVQSR